MLNQVERLYLRIVFDPMSNLVKLEKRFENAIERLELALESNDLERASESSKEKEQPIKESHDNIDDLLVKIAKLEKATKSDADEIDKLVRKLKEVFELVDD